MRRPLRASLPPEPPPARLLVERSHCKAGKHVGEHLPPRVEAVEPLYGTDPEAPFGSLVQLQHFVAGEALRALRNVPEARERAGRRIVEAAEAALVRADPELPAGPLRKGGDARSAQARRIAGVVRVAHEGARPAVHSTEALVGAYPERTPGVFVERCDEAAAEATRVAWLRPVDADVVAVIAAQTVLRAEPHEALPVLKDRLHGHLREPLLHREALEHQWLAERIARGARVQPAFPGGKRLGRGGGEQQRRQYEASQGVAREHGAGKGD